MKNTLALFDFDGTIYSKDSMIDFAIYFYGKGTFIKILLKLLPEIIKVKVFRKNPFKLKESFLKLSLKDITQDKFKIMGMEYAQKRIPDLVYKDAIKKLHWHLEEGHRVIIVSASIKEWLLPFSKKYGVELLCTEYDCAQNRLATKNCINMEKVNRVKSILDINEYDKIYAYGDSRGDKEMLSIATNPFYREFNQL